MKLGEIVEVGKYDEYASLLSVDGFTKVLILNNNSTHFLVVQQKNPDTRFPGHAEVIETFRYDNRRGSARTAYLAAVATMMSVWDTEEDSESVDDDACPGCGCVPGDGLSSGCNHPEGCGYWRQQHLDPGPRTNGGWGDPACPRT